MHITLILLIAQCFLSSAEDFTSTGSTTSKEIDQSSISSAGDFTATTGSSSKSSSSPDSMPNDLQRMVSNHMKLGRVLNALYVQMQLSENQIKGEDVLAAVWNLQGRQIIDDLVGFDYEQLKQQMLQLDGNLQLQNFSLMTDLLDSEYLSFARKTLEMVIGKDVKLMIETMVSDSMRLYFGRDSIAMQITSEFVDRTLNLVNEALKKLDDYNKEKDWVTYQELYLYLEGCISTIDSESLPAKIKFSVDAYNQDDLNDLFETFEFSRNLVNNETNFQNLSSFLNETYLKIEKLKLNFSIIDSHKDIDYGGKVIREVLNPSSGMYSALASLSEANFSIIYDDLKDEWLQNMLKYAKPKEELEVVLNKLKIYLEELSNVNEHLKSVISDTSHSDDLRDLIAVDTDRWNRFISSIHEAGICTGAVSTSPDPFYMEDLQKMEPIESSFDMLFYKTARMQSVLDNMQDREEFVISSIHEAGICTGVVRFYDFHIPKIDLIESSLDTLYTETARMLSVLDNMQEQEREEVLRVFRSAVQILRSASRSDYITKFESIDQALIKKTLLNANDTFEKFRMNRSVFASANALRKARESAVLIHWWLSTEVFMKDKCQQLLSSPFLSPQQIDELRMPLTLIRTVTEQKILPELASQFQKIAVLKSSLEKLNSIEVSPPSIQVMGKTERRFNSDIRDSLLGVIDVISIFGKMHQLFVNEPAFLAIMNHGDYVKKLVIQSADGQAIHESSKEIWSTHWDTFKENLMAFWRINSNAIQNIPTSSESSLKEISEKYRMIGESTSFVGLQQLDKLTILWNSMKHLNSKNNTEVQMVSDAFRQIQYPIMTVDWQSVGLKFQESAIKFDQVDGALHVFLGEDVSVNETSSAPPIFSTEYSKPTEDEELETKKPTAPTQFLTEYSKPTEAKELETRKPTAPSRLFMEYPNSTKEEELGTSEKPLENFQMREIRFFLTAGVCAVFWSNCNLFY